MDAPQDEYSEKEAKARFEAALRGTLQTPHTPLNTLSLAYRIWNRAMHNLTLSVRANTSQI
jgi:hypothetical protein